LARNHAIARPIEKADQRDTPRSPFKKPSSCLILYRAKRFNDREPAPMKDSNRHATRNPAPASPAQSHPTHSWACFTTQRSLARLVWGYGLRSRYVCSRAQPPARFDQNWAGASACSSASQACAAFARKGQEREARSKHTDVKREISSGGHKALRI